MNNVLILTHNNLFLTRRTISSVLAQDIPTFINIIDNGSTDGTHEVFEPEILIAYASNKGVSRGWNDGLDVLFRREHADHVLVLNNDVVLPPWFFRYLLGYPTPFITGIAVDDMDDIREPATEQPLCPHPDFSAFLICREAWEKIGEFDERMKLYASDCDYHIRGHRLGVSMMKANVPYFHASSSTLKNASPEERIQIEAQANADRAVFHSLYGCLPGTPEYNKLFE